MDPLAHVDVRLVLHLARDQRQRRSAPHVFPHVQIILGATGRKKHFMLCRGGKLWLDALIPYVKLTP